jgi:hypothetical protein
VSDIETKFLAFAIISLIPITFSIIGTLYFDDHPIITFKAKS